MKRLVFCLAAFAMSASGTAAYAQFQVSHPSIRHEEWHYDYTGMTQTGYFVEYCNGTYQWWGHPDAINYFADGDCEGYGG